MPALSAPREFSAENHVHRGALRRFGEREVHGIRLAPDRQTLWPPVAQMETWRRRMKSLGRMATGAAAGLLALAAVSWADEPAKEEPAKEPANPVDARIADVEKAIADVTGISLSGMFYFSWEYNFNRPQDGQNSLRSLDNRDNQLYVDLFQLQLTRQLVDGLSVTTKLDVGNTASRIGADWNGEGEFSGVSGNNSPFEIEEAYALYAPEWAHGWQVKGGKFVTLLGAEVIEA